MVNIDIGVQLRFNQKAIKKILTDPQLYDDMKRRADEIAKSANASVPKEYPGEADAYLSTELVLEEPRAAASVITYTRRGKRDNLRNGTLLKNLDKGR